MARLIGITGGIGAGKSVVSRVLRLKGFHVYDCDSEASRLMHEVGEIRVALTDRFGSECYIDWRLNRPYLASRIFACEEDRLWINSLVHEAVRRDIDRVAAGERILFVESAILSTSRLDGRCDLIWLVSAPEKMRISRALARGGERNDIARRIETQRKEFEALPEEKVRIIDNGEDRMLLPQIDRLLAEAAGGRR